MIRATAPPAASPARMGRRRAWDIVIYFSTGAGERRTGSVSGSDLPPRGPLSPLGRGKKAGQVIGERCESGGHLPVAAAGLEQLIGDRQGREDRDLVGVEGREHLAGPEHLRIEVGRHLARVLWRK